MEGKKYPPTYRQLYSQSKKMLEKYQDEIVPGFRAEVEELKKKLAEVTAERDAYFEEVRGYCHTCLHNHEEGFDCHIKCYGHQRGSAWEWRGKEVNHES